MTSAGPATPAGVPRASLRRGTLAVLSGNGLLNGARLVVVMLLAKFCSAEVLGQYNYGLALSGPVVLFCGLELRGVFVADAAGRFPFAAYRKLRSIGLAAAAVILSGLLAWEGSPGKNTALFILLCGAAAARLALYWAEIDWGVYQKHERLDLLGWSNGLRGITALLPFALLLPLGATLGPVSTSASAWNAAIATWAHALLWWGLALVYDRRNASRLGTPGAPSDASTLSRLAWHALPLGIVSLVVSLCENLPRLVIEAQPDGRRALGYFGAIATIPAAAQFVIVQLGIASSHRLATSYRSDRRAFLRLVLKLLAISAAGAVILLALAELCGEWLLRVAFRPEYAQHLAAFRVLALATSALLCSSILGFVATQMGIFRLQVAAQMAVLIATASCAFTLIPGDPINGAAWTALARGTVQAILYLACVIYGITRPVASKSAPAEAPFPDET